MYLYPYNVNSESSKLLAKALGIKRIKHEGSKFLPKGQTIINWGSTSIPAEYSLKCNVLNRDVVLAVNKLKFFQQVEGEPWCIPFTTNIDTAASWIDEGCVIVCRTKLTGHSGEGIVIANTKEELAPAPLYTKYMKKKDEYRIHISKGTIFLMQRKARNKDIPNEQVDWLVRNHANGFIYAHLDLDIPECVKAVAKACMEVLGLDFGAVDVTYNEASNKAYVLEVNSSPGLSGEETLKRYAAMFKEMYE